MKTRNSRNFLFQKLALKPTFSLLSSLALFLLIAMTLKVNAQNHTVLHDRGYDVKHYTTKSVPGNGDECAMAGTIFGTNPGYPWNKSQINFLRLDNQGNILVNKEVVSPFDEEYVVDMQPVINPLNGFNYWFITCLIRDGAGAEYIRVLCLTDNGSLFTWGQYAVNNSAQNLYPKHSTIWTDPNTGVHTLYICGYTTVGNTTLPNSPDYTSDKRAFVLAIDASFTWSQMNVLKSQQYDWGSYNGLDYDMAMHIEVIDATNELFMTGSVSGLAITPAGGSTQISRSATMNVVLDPTLPTTIPIISDNPFLQNIGSDDNTGPHDYGQDLIQHGGQYYILGNFAQEGTLPWAAGPTPQSAMFPRYGHGWYIAPLKADFTPANRWHYWLPQHNWARNAMITPNGDVVIATMLAAQYSTCFPEPPSMPGFYPTHANVLPNLVSVGLNGISQPSVYNSKIFMTTAGTGDPAVTASNYYTLGNQFLLIDYEPTFADVGDNQFLISAPRTIQTNGTLGLKYLNPDLSLNISCSDFTCSASFIAQNYMSVPAGSAAPLDIIFDHTISAFSIGTVQGYTSAAPCQDFSGATGYKTGNTTGVITLVDRSNETKVYPNPTKDNIHIALANDVSTNSHIQVRLTNIFGQDLGNLYDGIAGELIADKELSLPAQASGLYIIQVYVDGKLTSKEKLTIE